MGYRFLKNSKCILLSRIQYLGLGAKVCNAKRLSSSSEHCVGDGARHYIFRWFRSQSKSESLFLVTPLLQLLLQLPHLAKAARRGASYTDRQSNRQQKENGSAEERSGTTSRHVCEQLLLLAPWNKRHF